MKAERGMLIEMDLGQLGISELFISKIDQAQKRVFLEHKHTKKKIDLTFEEFMEVTGMELDTRDLLTG